VEDVVKCDAPPAEPQVEQQGLSTRFFAHVTHELRTPLIGMMGMIEILQKAANLNKDQQDMLRQVYENAEALQRIVNDTLDITSFESRGLALDFQPFRLDRMLESVLALIRVRASRKKLQLSSSIEEGVPLFLRSDEVRLRQMLFNLIGNAVKFTDEGSVTVLVRLTQPVNDNQVGLMFCVCDTGTGIAEEELALLFEPFKQLANAKGRDAGVGLGLSICKRIMDQMKGRLWAESTLGQGSAFHFELLFELASASETQALQQGPETKESPKAATRLKDLDAKVLIVEDHPTNAKVARLHLESAGLEVTWVENGQEALDLLSINPNFDVIVMDIQMPIVDGIEATQRIRKELKLEMPIIAMTANIMEENKSLCLDAGMNDFMSKPVRRKCYQELIEKWLLKSKSQPSADQTDTTNEDVPTASDNAGLQVKELPLDFALAVAEFEGDDDLVRSLIQDWIPQCEDDLLDTWKALEEGKVKHVASYAHRLKGAAANICAFPFSKAAKALENAAKNEEKDGMVGLYFQLQQAYGVLVAYLKWSAILSS
jgi:CheY-like chemotaxis protein